MQNGRGNGCKLSNSLYVFIEGSSIARSSSS